MGATSLSFILGQYLGVTDVESVLATLETPTVLVDSLDEARARVSGTSWAEFLESIADAARHGCRFVLFGRERTLEEVWVSLSDAGTSLAWLEISHFGSEERLQYVNGVVGRRSKDRSVLKSQYYQIARNAVLDSVVNSVPGQAAETFAGYAPVLDAVAAVLLREENHFAVSNTFGKSSGGMRHLEELRRILDDLLKRDQAKMKPLADMLGLDPSSIYTPEEQIRWLCHDLEDSSVPDLHHIKDPKVRHDYIESIRPFLNDHPFRNEAKWASTVFAAYAASKLFGTTINGERLIEIGNDSSLLFDLVALESDELLIDEWGFAALHASITAGEFSGSLATVTASEIGDGEYEGAMSVLRAGVPAQKGFTLIPESSQALRLFGPLAGLTLSTSSEVRIPGRNTPTVLGPDLFLHCRSLSIEGPAVEFAHRVSPTPESGAITVIVEVEEGPLQLPSVIAREPFPGDFELRVPENLALRYPWVNYRQPLELSDRLDPSDRAVRFLKMLMNLTRTHGHPGERGVFIMKLQGRQSLKGTQFKAAIDVLQRRGIVRVGGEMIYLREEYEPHRFSGKTRAGQRLIEDVWDVWGPVAKEIADDVA
ncbi:hypothetical protein OG320_09410 [Microbispora sp. NBC_01189]|uniref:hypothetical protein n=1 Tax=Microbispora sp. NBC_01189 TaxID=2903583 RepID=UPI002E0E2D50|nr:hypothetical protein OG320_09410 [Microbispora sp. NBC_01189]